MRPNKKYDPNVLGLGHGRTDGRMKELEGWERKGRCNEWKEILGFAVFELVNENYLSMSRSFIS